MGQSGEVAMQRPPCPPWNGHKAEAQAECGCVPRQAVVAQYRPRERVRVALFAAQQGAQEDDAGHGGPCQQPLVEALLALPALGGRVVPVEIHKTLLKDKREKTVRWGRRGDAPLLYRDTEGIDCTKSV